MVLWLTTVMSPSNMTEKRSSHTAHLSRDFQIALFIVMRLTHLISLHQFSLQHILCPFCVEKGSPKPHQRCKTFSQSPVLGHAKSLPGSWVGLPYITKAFTSLGCPFPAALVCPGLQRLEACGVHFVIQHKFQSQVEPVDLSSGTSSVLVMMTKG